MFLNFVCVLKFQSNWQGSTGKFELAFVSLFLVHSS